MPANCPACAGPESTELFEPFGPRYARQVYRRCLNCGSLFSSHLLGHPLTPQEWESLPRPEESGRGVPGLLRPFYGKACVALAGRVDIELLKAFRDRGSSVFACDSSKSIVARGAGDSFSLRLGRPAAGALKGLYDLILVEGLLEYSDNPCDELVAVRKALFPDGRVRVEAVAADGSLVRQMGSLFSLFSPPAVRTLYTFDGLSMLLARAGFRQISRLRNPGRAFDWLLRGQPFATKWDQRIAGVMDRISGESSILVVSARHD